MIITQTPLRISLLGGGTDIASYFDHAPGAVVSTTIDKYIYVVAKERYDSRLRAGYSRTELAGSVNELEHDLVREVLLLTGLEHGVEVSTLADIPSRGSGLGSSSAVTVGMLHAIWVLLGELPSRCQLAEAACRIEIDELGRPIGMQDQYAAAYGGLRHYTFTSEGVAVSAALGSPDAVRRLSESLLLFFTGRTRRSTRTLQEQGDNAARNRPVLAQLKGLADDARSAIEAGDVDAIGELLHEGWERKRTLASRISDSDIDRMYSAARTAGATGGKICGAGGGGFMLLFVPPERGESVRRALDGFSEVTFSLDSGGTRVLANATRTTGWQSPERTDGTARTHTPPVAAHHNNGGHNSPS